MTEEEERGGRAEGGDSDL